MKTTRLLLTAFCLSLSLSGCFLKQDRTTVVYGTITDEKGRPVDSILVDVSGVKFWYTTHLKKVYTDSAGKYEITVEVSKKFSAVNVTIPSTPENRKFQASYEGYVTWRDGNRTRNCCLADIGRKTEYNYQLNSK